MPGDKALVAGGLRAEKHHSQPDRGHTHQQPCGIPSHLHASNHRNHPRQTNHERNFPHHIPPIRQRTPHASERPPMPTRAPRRCTRCRQPCVTSPCPDCEKRRQHTVNTRRRTAPRNQYDTPHHRQWSRQVLNRDRWCQCQGCPSCHQSRHGSPPCVRSSHHADHHPHTRQTLVDMGADPHDPTTGRGLCHRCHSHKTATNDGGFGNPSTA